MPHRRTASTSPNPLATLTENWYVIFQKPSRREGGLCLYGDEDDDNQDVIFAQLDATTGMGTETSVAIAFVPEESILHVGGV